MASIADPGKFNVLSADTDAIAFRVKLRDNKAIVVLASHPYEAVEKYKYACGIISTDNPFDVVAVKDEAGLAEAKDLPARPSNAPPLVGFVDASKKEEHLGVFAV